jgi:pimeloyl-ACP methyl ester carboxylesterase
MCWSYRRRRDRPLLDCLSELEAPIEQLSGRGVRAIAVAGMSVGGLGAVAFGARRQGLVGIIALAATGRRSAWCVSFPRSPRRRRWSPPAAATNAPALPTEISAGLFPINTTAAIYLSFFDPTGPANIPDNTSRLRAPLLWVAGTADRSQTGPDYAFSRAPANLQHRYVMVDSDHLGTPTAAREASRGRKLSRKFYVAKERRSFRTAWVETRP